MPSSGHGRIAAAALAVAMVAVACTTGSSATSDPTPPTQANAEQNPIDGNVVTVTTEDVAEESCPGRDVYHRYWSQIWQGQTADWNQLLAELNRALGGNGGQFSASEERYIDLRDENTLGAEELRDEADAYGDPDPWLELADAYDQLAVAADLAAEAAAERYNGAADDALFAFFEAQRIRDSASLGC